jgi:hypothetical protein
VDGSVVTLAIPTPILGFWIERNYMEGLVRVARSLYGEALNRSMKEMLSYRPSNAKLEKWLKELRD